MQRYAEYARIYEQSYRQLSAHTAEELSIGLMYRYESCKGSLESDVEMLVKYCGDKVEEVMLSSLKYIRKVFTSHSWQYYNVLFETAWAAYRCCRPLRAAKLFRSALLLNDRKKNDCISGIDAYCRNDFYDSSEKDMSKPEELIDRNTAYSLGIRNRVLQRHFARAAETFEAAGFPFEAEALYKKLCDEQLRYGLPAYAGFEITFLPRAKGNCIDMTEAKTLLSTQMYKRHRAAPPYAARRLTPYAIMR